VLLENDGASRLKNAEGDSQDIQPIASKNVCQIAHESQSGLNSNVYEDRKCNSPL